MGTHLAARILLPAMTPLTSMQLSNASCHGLGLLTINAIDSVAAAAGYPLQYMHSSDNRSCHVADGLVRLLQGDTEARLGLSVTPFCDRRTVVVSTMQLRFVDMFLRPLLPHLTWAVGTALSQELTAGLAHTVAHWTEHRQAAPTSES